MLIWKVIAANPGITREELFARVEHDIPAGWAKRRYAVWKGGSAEALPLPSARRYILRNLLSQMRKYGSIARDDDGHYTILRPIRQYKGNPDHVDETGTRMAEHLRFADALKT